MAETPESRPTPDAPRPHPEPAPRRHEAPADPPTQGWRCGHEGLVVLYRAGRIRLTHAASGMHLADFPTVSAARRAADALAALADWTAHLDELRLDECTARAVELVMSSHGGGDTNPNGALEPFDLFWARPRADLPDADREAFLATPAWPVGVDGLAAVWASSSLQLVHVMSGRSLGALASLAAARLAAPMLLCLTAPSGWVTPFERLAAGGPGLWRAVASVIASSDAAVESEAPGEPECRALTLRPAWSCPDPDLAVCLAPEGLVVVETTTGERLSGPQPTLGAARSFAAQLAEQLARARLTAAQAAEHWRASVGLEPSLGPGNPRA